MATWKENGVVPDSEDEDLLDTQSTEASDSIIGHKTRPSNETRHTFSNHGNEEDSQESNLFQVAPLRSLSQSNDIPLKDKSQQKWKSSPSPDETLQNRSLRESDQLIAPVESFALESSQQFNPEDPPHLHGWKSNVLQGNFPPASPRQVDDEISKSYVLLSSPLSSLSSLSSRDINLQDSWETGGGSLGTHRTESRVNAGSSRTSCYDRDLGIVDEEWKNSCINRRSLRQRNPIQLHPYALEGEKYRQTLMARGLKPLKIATIQNGMEPNTRTDDSQDTEFNAEQSQIPALEEGSQNSSSASQNQTHTGQEPFINPFRNISFQDDEDFPDIDVLVDRQHSDSVRNLHKRRKVSRGRPSALRTYARPRKTTETPDNDITMTDDVFDVPPSPPATSPLFDSLSSGTPINMPRFLSPMVTGMPAVEGDDSRKCLGAVELPTPITSTIKNSVDLTTMADSDDIEDSFISEAEYDTVSAASEPDELIQIRRVGKKIRGVLPASWLRLDQQTSQPGRPRPANRDRGSLSPVKTVRRGVATAKPSATSNSPRTSKEIPDPFFLSEESDVEEGAPLPASTGRSDRELETPSSFSRSEMSFMFEDDRVDQMLPSEKRQAKLLPTTYRRKKRVISNSLFRKNSGAGLHQPKITEQLLTPRRSNALRLRKNNNIGHEVRRRQANRQLATYRRKSQNLSILDVINPSEHSTNRLPQFIRIAARNARSHRAFGRRSPTNIFIRMANRQDTKEVQDVLRDWREGASRPRDMDTSRQLKFPISNHNHNNKTPDAGPSGRQLINRDTFVPPNMPRQITVSRMNQIQISCAGVIDPDGLGGDSKPNIQPLNTIEPNLVSKTRLSRPLQTYNVRPAQLETSVAEHDLRHPGASFGSRKKVLDALYRKGDQGSMVRSDIPLARFLYDADSILRESAAIPYAEHPIKSSTMPVTTELPQLVRNRKRVPKRIDAGAADYRQPSPPLILELLRATSEPQEARSNDGRLAGLGSFGTQYTCTFDIFPLHDDVYFHESTFVGSGGFSEVLNVRYNNYFQPNRGHAIFQVSEKRMRWGIWDDEISSEVGLCFDWISDQLQESIAADCWTSTRNVLECVSFMIDYVRDHLSFEDLETAQECLARFSEAARGLNESMESLSDSCKPESDPKIQHIAKLSILNTILTFEFLQISDSMFNGSLINSAFQNAFKTSSATSSRLLLQVGLESVRQLFDDLQYLAIRERGIKSDQYVAEGWVTIIHLVQAAHIPRFSFWDLVNSKLLSCEVNRESDARELEKSWYSLFSLLPLFQFNQRGTIIPMRQQKIGLENWSLIQQLIKPVFELYSTNARQSPSFNDYCRALFTRVHHLTQVWGWHRCGTIIGTLFDFFASQKLEHLRNEEVHQSPRFLQQLHLEPQIQIEPEDRCFHIFLKVIGSAISQMRANGDFKNIRNLVIRLLPNHDRQYPKEEEVQERHLASLRNHHDLLCTLFWAAPAELRPSTNLISELVNVATSHKEAIFINLRSWTSLCHFVLSSAPTPEAYSPLLMWQQNSFDQLISQYHSAAADIEEQFNRLPGPRKNLISAERILHTVKCNRKEIIDTIRAQVAAVTYLMQDATTMDAVQLAFIGRGETEALIGMLRHFNGSDQLTLPVIEKLMDAIQMFIRKLNVLTPAISEKSDSALETEDDSQDYGGDLIEEFTRCQYLETLNGELLGSLRDMIRKCVCCATSSERVFMEKLTKTYGLVAGTLVRSKLREYYEFTSQTGRYAAITIGSPEAMSREYGPLFVAELLEAVNFFPDLDELSTCNMISDWLFLLVKPREILRYEHRFMEVVSKLGLLSPVEDTPPVTSFHNITLYDLQTHRHNIIVGSFRKMHALLANNELLAKFYPTSTTAQMRTRFGAIASRVMKTMETDISSMVNGSIEQADHKSFASYVALDIKVYFPSDYHFDRFLSTTIGMKTHTDPENFISTLRSYGLRLQTDRGKQEFNHLVIGAFKTSALDKTLQLMPKSLVTAMSCNAQHGDDWIDLVMRLLSYVTPACVHVAFKTPSGWLIAEPLLIAAAMQLTSISQTENAVGAVDIARTILRSIINSIQGLASQYDVDSRLPLQHEHIYALILITRFINSTFQWLLHLANQLDAPLNEEVLEIFKTFSSFAKSAKKYVESPMGVLIEHWEERQQCDMLSFENTTPSNSSYSASENSKLDPERIDMLLNAVDEYITHSQLGNLDLIRFHSKHGQLAPKIILLANDIAMRGPAHNILRSQLSDIARGVRPNGGLLFLGIRPQSLSNSQDKVPPPSDFAKLLLSEIKINWDFQENTGRIAIRNGQSYHEAGQLEHSERNRRRLCSALVSEIKLFLREHERQTRDEGRAIKRGSEVFLVQELWI